MRARDGRRTCSPNVADPHRTSRALPEWLEQQEQRAWGAWRVWAEPPVRQARRGSQQRTERLAAKEELVRHERERKGGGASERWAHPGRPPKQSEYSIRTRR